MFVDGDAYEQFMGRWSSVVADVFVDALDMPAGAAVLDIGCGSGALLERLAHRHPSELIGVDPSSAQLAQARRRLPDARFLEGGAEDLPLDDDAVDVAVTALALNFCPDPARAVTEMLRVTRYGGIVAGYVWDYAHEGFFLERYWAAATAVCGPIDVGERTRWDVCTTAGLRAVLPGGGRVWSIEVGTPFATTDELWDAFGLGVGPAGTHRRSLDDATAAAVRSELARRVTEVGGPAGLTARALAFRV